MKITKLLPLIINSLYGLSFVGHFLLMMSSGTFFVQTLVSCGGIVVMCLVAYYISWSKKQDKPLPKTAPAQAGPSAGKDDA